MSKAKKTAIGVGLVVILGALIVFQLRTKDQETVHVKTAEVIREKIVEKVVAPARIQPVTLVNISADVMGQIVELAVEEGAWVEKGQFLLQIDPSIYQSAVDRNQALVQSALADEELAGANLKQAKLSLSRKQNLFEQNLTSQEELELAETQVEINQAQLRSAMERVRQARASLDEARSNLKKTRLVAPMEGTVSQLNVEEGETAVTGTMNNPGTVLLSIADLARMEAQADVDETDVVHLEVDQLVEIEVDALPDTILTGTVREIANTATILARGTEREVANFTVTVDVTHFHPKLRPGMSATLSIITGTSEDALAVPIQSIVLRRPSELKSGDGSEQPSQTSKSTAEGEPVVGIFQVEEGTGEAGTTAQFVKVKTGISSDTMIELLSGLDEGQEVVTGPYQALLDLKDGVSITADGKDLSSN